MGGNAIFNGQEADRIDLQEIDRKKIVDRLDNLFETVNFALLEYSGTELWDTQNLGSWSSFLAGSTPYLFDMSISDEELKLVKPSFGDIDIQINRDHVRDLEDWLRSGAPGQYQEEGSDWILKGWETHPGTIVTLWYDYDLDIHVQVDFEPVEFEFGFPSDWAQFSHSSDWEDMKLGIKGVAHKYIFRAITAKDLQTCQPVKLKTKVVYKSITPWVFSPKGMRQKWVTDGEFWYEVAMDEKKLVRDVFEISKILFGDIDEDDDDLMNSYIGVCELIDKYIPRDRHGSIVMGMANLLWGPGAQCLYRDDNDQDEFEKRVMFNYLTNTLHNFYKPTDLIAEYYQESNGPF